MSQTRRIGQPHVRRRSAAGLCLAVAAGALFAAAPHAAAAITTTRFDAPAAESDTTAWDGARYAVDTQGVVSRSDVVLDQAPVQPTQSMPLGNGTLGAAAWDADGLTVQLNRADTLPDRKSPGRLVIPGLARLTGAADYRGRLDLYDGVLHQSGGGLTSDTFVRADKDELVVQVHGADPGATQTADLRLWSPRAPSALTAAGPIAALAETWTDQRGSGATGATFGSLAGLAAGARDVTAAVVDPLTVRLTFKAGADGSFRIVVAAPSYRGGDPVALLNDALGADATRPLDTLESKHAAWWHRFWSSVGPIKLASADGAAQYLENIRTIDLYAAAAEERGARPGSQAGVADLFAYSGDAHQWDPSAYWHWNLRAQTAANLGAGAATLDDPYFRLYRDNLSNLLDWTTTHMGGRAGICVPETMRFNGQGYENEDWLSFPGLNCDAGSGPYYNARTITTGAEVSLNVWQRYLFTGEKGFIRQNYPLLAESARFLLAYATAGANGALHTYPSNAHETQWDVHDPTTDIAAMRALFPVVIDAANALHTDGDLAGQLQDALTKLLPYKTSGAPGSDVIADSYDPNASIHNSENIGLEPVWPYGLIGDDSGAATDLARRTYAQRPNKLVNDWSFDAVQAARLGLPGDVRSALVGLTEKYQVFPSGLGNLFGSARQEPYIEQAAAVADALQEALVQDYDGLLRIAPALPADWDADGTVFVPGGKVDVQVRSGTPVTVVIEAASDAAMRVRNPWPGQQVEVIAVQNGHIRKGDGLAPTSADQFTVPVRSGVDYLVQRVDEPISSLKFAPVSGTAATRAKALGSRTIGLLPPAPPLPSLAAGYDNVAVTDDAHTDAGNIDGGGASLSAQALASVGAAPNATVQHGGVSFTWPDAGGGQPDNATCSGQTITFTGTGTTLGFLLTGTYGPISGAGVIRYTDGTAQQYTIGAPDWNGSPPAGSDPVFVSPYQNRPGDTHYDHPGVVYFAGVRLTAGKAIAQVTLPDISGTTPARVPILHVFAVAVG